MFWNIILFSVIVYQLHSARSLSNAVKSNVPDSKLNFTELAGKYGYTTEEHKITTEDGYILTIFRMKGKRCEEKRLPVVLMHGLLMSSDAFIDAGPDAGLAYLLADDCQDLWVGNSRGNYYSRAHVYLNPDKDAQFWKFSVDEMGYYDVPATIDYVLDQTGEQKLNYIGYSQGAGTVFIMCSERPGYCDKLNLLIGLAPAARQTNTKSLLYRTACTTISKFDEAFKKAGIYEIFGKEIRDVLSEFCKIDDQAAAICQDILWLLDSAYGPHPKSISNRTLRTLFGHFPAGTSLQNMVRYGQSMLTKNFQKFDYGLENIKIYKTFNPPKYNLSASTMPMTILYGENNGMVDVKDVEWLVSKLPNVLESTPISDPKWTHLDNTYSRYTAQSTFPKIQEYLRKYSN